MTQTKLEYEVLVTAVDKSGNKTEALVKVNNAKIQEMKSIKLKQITSQGSSAVEIYAVALDANGNVLLKIPKENLKWQLYSDDGNIYFDIRSNENVVLVPGSDNSDYAVSASWKISEKFSLTDILLKSDISGQGDINPEPGKPGETDPGEEKPEPGKTDPGVIVPNQGYPGVTLDDSVYKDVLASFRKEMSAKSGFLITSVYPRIDNRLSMQGLKINIPIQSITQADYFIIARDPDTSRYEQTIQQDMRFVSDIVQFQALKHDNVLPGQYTMTIPYNASYEVDMRRLSVYAYSEILGKWIRMIGSDVDPINHTVTFLT